MDCTEVKDLEIGLVAVNNLFQDSEPVGRAVEIRERARAEGHVGKLHTSTTLRTSLLVTSSGYISFPLVEHCDTELGV